MIFKRLVKLANQLDGEGQYKLADKMEKLAIESSPVNNPMQASNPYKKFVGKDTKTGADWYDDGQQLWYQDPKDNQLHPYPYSQFPQYKYNTSNNYQSNWKDSQQLSQSVYGDWKPPTSQYQQGEWRNDTTNIMGKQYEMPRYVITKESKLPISFTDKTGYPMVADAYPQSISPGGMVFAIPDALFDKVQAGDPAAMQQAKALAQQYREKMDNPNTNWDTGRNPFKK